jgi:ubiquinone biosynthesis protein UbiJ
MSDSHPRHPVLDLLGRLFETALNRTLALDATAIERIRALEGRTVRVDLRHLDIALQLTARDGRLQVGPAGEGADLALRASLGSLLAMALSRESARPVGRIEIAGDAELARRVEQLLRGFDPDWAEPLAQAFGDVAGHQLAQALRAGFGGAARLARGLGRDMVEYLREETGDAVARPEAEQFYDEVDLLRESADRLEARIRRLAEALGNPRA